MRPPRTGGRPAAGHAGRHLAQVAQSVAETVNPPHYVPALKVTHSITPRHRRGPALRPIAHGRLLLRRWEDVASAACEPIGTSRYGATAQAPAPAGMQPRPGHILPSWPTVV